MSGANDPVASLRPVGIPITGPKVTGEMETGRSRIGCRQIRAGVERNGLPAKPAKSPLLRLTGVEGVSTDADPADASFFKELAQMIVGRGAGERQILF